MTTVPPECALSAFDGDAESAQYQAFPGTDGPLWGRDITAGGAALLAPLAVLGLIAVARLVVA